MNILRMWLSVLLLGLLAACGGGGDSAAPPAPNPPAPAAAATAAVDVIVIDTLGRFVAGVAVSSGSQQVTTNASGHATLPVATGSEQLVTLGKAGFAEQVKLITVPSVRSADALRVMLVERDAAVAINTIENGGSASGRDGVKVTFPAAALVNAAGAAVTGTIQMQMTPVNVVELDADAFPGAFEGTPSGGARAAIMSYGTAELLPLQGGQKLNLAAGKTAQIELPIYANVHQGSAPVLIGDTIALWSLNASTGLWTQEGTGTVVASAASPTGKALRATISHFSWWNGDVSSQMGRVNLTVVVPNPNAPVAAGTLASVSGQVVAGGGPGWVASASVPIGVATPLSVPSNATTRIEARVDLPTQVCVGRADASPAPNANVDVTISAACFTVPVPTIVQPVNNTLTNSSGALTVTTTIEGSPPDALDVLVDGTLDPNQHIGFAQFFYRTAWNLASLSEGTHTLVARATRAGVTRDSAAVTVTIDRTPPRATAISPLASAEVSNSTEFDVDFSEPVFAGRPDLVLTDVVKLSVLPIGQATPVDIPITASFQNGQLHVHVTVNQALPLGTASLTWASLRDGAGNTVGNPIGQSWNVARTAQLGTSDALFSNTTFVMNTNSAGTVFTLHRRASDGNLVASQLGATGLVQIGPVVNDRTPGGDNNGSIAADANGVPFVAFVQANAAGTAGEVVVKRFDANANAWVTLVAPFALTITQNQSILPKLQLNAAGQPVLVFTNQAVLRGFRFDGTAWVDLGSFADPFISQLEMVLDNNGSPIAAPFDGGTLRVLRNTGSAWVAIASSLDSAPDGTHGIASVSMALDGAGQPWLAWLHFHGGNVLHVVRFNGTNFVDVALPPTPPSGHPSITFINGDPVIALGDDSSNVLRFHNGAWEAPVPVAVDGRGPVIARPSNGALIFAATSGFGTLLKVSFP